MADVLVKGEGVGRRFRQGDADVCALQPASFMIRPGDRIALLGRSGSGKSTLLDLIADLDAPTAGRLTWPALGPRGTLRPKYIGVAFQAPSLIPTLNVVENVEVPLRLAGEAAAAHGTALKALEALDLADLADRLPEELSGGQSQRVALARAIAIAPRLILADEPTGQLDHPTGRRAMDALLSSIDGTDAALVIATHDSTLAERMKTIWLMDHGCLQISGARTDL